jgi:alkaline phosphatase
VKSFDGAVGVNMDSISIPSMVKIGADNNMKTGVVTTASMTHVSSAAFWAHSSGYKNEEFIASQLPGSPLDLIIGGGEKFFTDREDKKNILKELRSQGYQTLSMLPDANSFPIADITKKYAAFTAVDLPLTVMEGRKYLSSAVSFAIDFLDTKDKKNDGFFLLVNSAQVALGAMLNNPDYMLSEYNDFDEALAKVLDFAERDKETLVIVTSTYETGGYSVNPGSKREKLQHEFTGKTTTGTLVPVFSQGPGAIKFTGFFENTDFLPKLKALFGWN